MARVIKADRGAVKNPRPARIGRVQTGRKVIDKEIYGAQEAAREILADAAAKKAALITDGRQNATQAREEAMMAGAEDAFSEAAAEALEAFRHRAERYSEAADDVLYLAQQVAAKIMGRPLSLDDDAVMRVLAGGMNRLRARRKLRIQIPSERLEHLAEDRPMLLEALLSEPDLMVEAADDVSSGFARVVTEVGSALCTEQAALDSMATALAVQERAVAPPPHSVYTHVGDGVDLAALRAAPVPVDDGRGPFANLHDLADDDDDEDTAHLQARGAIPDSLSDTGVALDAPPSRKRSGGAVQAGGGATSLKSPEPVSVVDDAVLNRVRAQSADPERTMALDVRDLQQDFGSTNVPSDVDEASVELENDGDDLDADDLDLFSDPSLEP